MSDSETRSLAAFIADRMRDGRNELTGRWLERLVARVDLPANSVFPSDDLLDHMPLLIAGIADQIRDPSVPVGAASTVVGRAMELGALRHRQNFSESEILKEFEILGGILFQFVDAAIAAYGGPVTGGEVIACSHRLFVALAVIQQAATAHYLQLLRTELNEREERLRAFNRALTHEFRNRIGAALGAGQILELSNLDEGERGRITAVIVRNMNSMRIVLENLLELTQVNLESRRQRHVRLPEAVAEALVHLGDLARVRSVNVEVAGELPDVEVSAAIVELCLTNLVSNAIKYADPRRENRWVRVQGESRCDAQGSPIDVTIEVRDNGIGVPEEQRDQLFQRLFRADNAHAGAEGSGLGLSIAREMIESLGGRIWLAPTDEGAAFVFSLPCRRVSDQTLPPMRAAVPVT